MRPFHHITIVAFACAGTLLAAWWVWGVPLWWLVVLGLIYLHVLALGAVLIRWNFFLHSHHRGLSPQEIALTFDDGPATFTGQILDVLKEAGVPAAFFLIGKQSDAQPALVQRIHAEGHLLGNHSYHHGFHFDWKSAGAMQEELERTAGAIQNVTGRYPRFFRPPYGVTNPALAKAVRRLGLQSIGWSVRSLDTVTKNPATLAGRVLGRLRGGDIILLHDSQASTAEALPHIIQRARESGYTFVRLDQLLQSAAYA